MIPCLIVKKSSNIKRRGREVVSRHKRVYVQEGFVVCLARNRPPMSCSTTAKLLICTTPLPAIGQQNRLALANKHDSAEVPTAWLEGSNDLLLDL